VFLLIPLSSSVLAVLLLGDVIAMSFVTGAALLIAGVWLGALHRAPEMPEEATGDACAESPTVAVC